MITRQFKILSRPPEVNARTVEVDATEDELTHLANEGYLVRPRLIPPDMLARLREAADELEARYYTEKYVSDSGFGGFFIRPFLDYHKTFHELIDYQPLVSVSRAMLGPQVQIVTNALRIGYPNKIQQAVEWHFHIRVVPEPKPPFFKRPEGIDHLIYLDDLTLESGPLLVLPGTHLIDRAQSAADHADRPGQVAVTCPAGSVVTASAALWHRAMAPTTHGGRRRLVAIGHGPIWLKPYDKLSAGRGFGLTDELVPDATPEMRELLGLAETPR